MKVFFNLIFLALFSSVAYADSATLDKGWNLTGINSNLTLQELGEGDILDIRDGVSESVIDGFDFAKYGYFVKSKDQKTLNYTADTYEDKTVELKAGWNLINPISELTLQEIKEQVDADNLEEIKGGKSVYKKDNLEPLNNFEQFKEPLGYWIKVTNSALLNFEKRVYGKSLGKEVSVYSHDEGDTVIYYPKDISSENKTPVILFVPGWTFDEETQSHNEYKPLLTFIASQGYSVFYAKSTNRLTSEDFIKKFETITSLAGVPQNIDTSKFGVVGYSYGGGLAYSIFNHFEKEKSWGQNGKFIFTIAPWFAFDMSVEKFNTIASDTKVVNVEFKDDNSTDHRITLTLYNQLTRINDENKDFQVVDTNDHFYPVWNEVDEIQGVLKPLDALMDYALHSKSSAYNEALGVGTDNPLELLEIKDRDYYQYKCNDIDRNITNIDYCSILD